MLLKVSIYDKLDKFVNGVSRSFVIYLYNITNNIPYRDDDIVIFLDIFFIIMDMILLNIITKIGSFMVNNPRIIDIVKILSSLNILVISVSLFLILKIYCMIMEVINDKDIDINRFDIVLNDLFIKLYIIISIMKGISEYKYLLNILDD